MQTASVPNITIRDVPPAVHQRLVQRAAKRGQSLQQYLVDLLTQLTAAPTMDEWLDEVDAFHATFDPAVDRSFDDVGYLHAAHEERGARLSGL
jgi:acyl-CoA hydrolase